MGKKFSTILGVAFIYLTLMRLHAKFDESIHQPAETYSAYLGSLR